MWIPFFTLLAIVTALGAGLWLAALNVQYRDVRYGLPFVTQFYLFESILRLRFDLTKDLISHMFMPAVALALMRAIKCALDPDCLLNPGKVI